MSSLREESLELHRKLKGKISQENKVAVETYDDLRLLYSPGVAEPCLEIQKDPSKAYDYTRKGNTIGVFSDGSSVLGLGNIWPLASLPVMEGKAMLIKEFGGINAIPLIIDSQDIETVISTIKLLAPWFGGIHLEDIAAPACFEIEDRLAAELDIPVFHDDQHGTAIIVLAGLINSLKLVGKNKEDVKVVLNGAGSAGFRIAELLRAYGFRNIITFDSQGAIHTGRGELNKQKLLLASYNVENFSGNSLSEGIGGRDVFIGVSRPNMLQTEDIKLMNADSIVFALANPTPEIGYEEAKMGGAAIVATGRSDFPNQINNLSVFPGLRKGLLEKRISKVTIEHKLKLSQILVDYMGEEIDSEHIIPSVFDRNVAQVIADGL
jgi:malate dehydrogenase (oxaloacetate-decarboxylating)